MVKRRQGEGIRLYVRGIILGYKRSKSNNCPVAYYDDGPTKNKGKVASPITPVLTRRPQSPCNSTISNNHGITTSSSPSPFNSNEPDPFTKISP
ncbi:putative 60S ribosomal protein L35a [Corchorus olitorius]|uniref:60S ribosomal protein L35a n=1 Tax=Corchorus olitorius TaxID=93759 RepID=A0A1R3GM66_9ROSI|nr:putative 60S ribosomal protein L35a [Corchorus olitorius]